VFTKGGEQDLAFRVSDLLFHGLIPKCPLCGHDVVFSSGRFKCLGYASEWSKCLFTATSMDRTKPVVPSIENPFLDKFKFRQHKVWKQLWCFSFYF
jgi:poly [ADP-ribose] polymerase 1